MAFIPPLELKTWILSVFSGTPEIFTAVSLLAISMMAGYFRMSSIGLFFIIGMFLLMFSGFITSPLIIFVAVIGGLIIGLVMSKIFVN